MTLFVYLRALIIHHCLVDYLTLLFSSASYVCSFLRWAIQAADTSYRGTNLLGWHCWWRCCEAGISGHTGKFFTQDKAWRLPGAHTCWGSLPDLSIDAVNCWTFAACCWLETPLICQFLHETEGQWHCWQKLLSWRWILNLDRSHNSFTKSLCSWIFKWRSIFRGYMWEGKTRKEEKIASQRWYWQGGNWLAQEQTDLPTRLQDIQNEPSFKQSAKSWDCHALEFCCQILYYVLQPKVPCKHQSLKISPSDVLVIDMAILFRTVLWCITILERHLITGRLGFVRWERLISGFKSLARMVKMRA